MNWKIVIQKFFLTAFTGAIASIGTVVASPLGMEGLDVKATTLISVVVGFAGALVNWFKNNTR